MGRVVFIVDDDTDDREFICEALHEIDADIECVCAGNGTEAIALFAQLQNDLPEYIFLDMNMPRLGGKQLLTLIKQDPKLRHIPVVVFSTTRPQEEAENVRKLGAALFLTKPASYTELKNNLSLILSRSWNQIAI